MRSFIFTGIFMRRQIFSNNLQRAYFAVAGRTFAVSMIAIFEPLYLLNIFRSHGIHYEISLVLLYFATIFLFYGILSPLGARLAAKFGLKTVILVSVPFLFAYYATLLYASEAPIFILLAMFLQIIHMTLHWPAFHFFFAKAGSDAHRGREVSVLIMVSGLAALAGPPLGGLIISFLGFPALFTVVLVTLTLMTIPFLFVEEKKIHYEGNLFKEFKNVLSLKYRKESVAFAARGIEDNANGVLWPIFLFFHALSFFSIGLIMFGATTVILLVTFIIGQLSDKKDKRMVLKVGSIITSLSWFGRMLVQTPITALAVNLFYGLGITTVAVPFASIFYEGVDRESENPYHVIIVREVAVNFGKALFIVPCAVVMLLSPDVGILFPIIAVITLLISII